YVQADTIAEFLNTKSFKDYFDFMYQGRIRNKVTKVVNYQFNRNCEDKKLPGHPNAWGYIDNEDINQVFSDLNLNAEEYTNVSVFNNCNWGGGWAIATGAVINEEYLSVSNLT